jgi:Zn-dependent protease with chaperone function
MAPRYELRHLMLLRPHSPWRCHTMSIDMNMAIFTGAGLPWTHEGSPPSASLPTMEYRPASTPPPSGGVNALAPSERRSFFDEQARNRAASAHLQRLTTVLAIVIATGFTALVIACCFLVVFAAIFIPTVPVALLSYFIPPLQPLSSLGFAMIDFVLALFGSPRLMFGGSIAFAVLGWIGCRRLWLEAGADPMLERLGARPLDPGDEEEQQLRNVVDEMAVAAAVPPPRTMVVEAGVANAALFIGAGEDEHHSIVVVSRGLLDSLDRDETQGVAAHLVASAANGDARLLGTLTSMFYILRLLQVVVLFPFMDAPRRILRSFATAQLAISQRRPDRAAAAAAAVRLLTEEEVLESITRSTSSSNDIDHRRFNRLGAYLVRVVPPMLSLIGVLQIAVAFMEMLAGVPAALIWRRRRLLADATAVQLTRNPNGLGRALQHLSTSSAVFPGAHALSHMFIVGDRSEGTPSGQRAESFEERHGVMIGMHPPLKRRLRLMQQMGADHITTRFGPDYTPAILSAVLLSMLFLIALAVWRG